ncbi:MAG: hypothetical protein QGG48_05215 [Desulfatiglandales bacterium]|nr:hypothetical protein [Desulfatiglandales bacterium]
MEIKRVVVTGMGLHVPPSATEKYGCCRPIGGQNRSGFTSIPENNLPYHFARGGLRWGWMSHRG